MSHNLGNQPLDLRERSPIVKSHPRERSCVCPLCRNPLTTGGDGLSCSAARRVCLPPHRLAHQPMRSPRCRIWSSLGASVVEAHTFQHEVKQHWWAHADALEGAGPGV